MTEFRVGDYVKTYNTIYEITRIEKPSADYRRRTEVYYGYQRISFDGKFGLRTWFPKYNKDGTPKKSTQRELEINR